MKFGHISIFIFCLVVFASCTKDGDLVDPMSDKSEFLGDYSKLYVSIYSNSACDSECNGGCSGSNSTRLYINGTIQLFKNQEDFVNDISPLKQLKTDQSGNAKFESLSRESYYMHVTCSLGTRSILISTPKGKTSSVSIGL